MCDIYFTLPPLVQIYVILSYSVRAPTDRIVRGFYVLTGRAVSRGRQISTASQRVLTLSVAPRPLGRYLPHHPSQQRRWPLLYQVLSWTQWCVASSGMHALLCTIIYCHSSTTTQPSASYLRFGR